MDLTIRTQRFVLGQILRAGCRGIYIQMQQHLQLWKDRRAEDHFDDFVRHALRPSYSRKEGIRAQIELQLVG